MAALIGQKEYGKVLKRSTYITLITVLFLILIKAIAFWFTGSIVILSTLADSFFDFVITATNFFLVRMSLREETDQHRFGFGKYEALSSFIEAMFIFSVSMFILFLSAQRVISPETIPHTNIALTVMIVSIIVNFFLVRYQSSIIKETESISARAEHTHYFQDLLTNLAVIVAIVLVGNFNLTLADPLFAAAISIYMIYSSIGIFRKSIDILIDKEIDDKLKDEIKQIVMSHPKVDGFHDFKTRQSGSSQGKFFMQMHIEINEHTSLNESHNIVDQVEEQILKEFPDVEVILHVDPNNIVEKKVWND